MRLLLIIFFLLITNALTAQQPGYTIVYSHYYGINARANKNSATFSRDEALFINKDSITFFEFLYQKKDEDKDQIGNEDLHHSIYTLLKPENFLYEVAYNKERVLIKDTLNKYQWQLITDSIEVCGYKCYKAISGKITAWYAADIKIAAGPAAYAGLPGLILKLHDRSKDFLFIANKIFDKAPQIKFPDDMEIVSIKEYKKSK